MRTDHQRKKLDFFCINYKLKNFLSPNTPSPNHLFSLSIYNQYLIFIEQNSKSQFWFKMRNETLLKTLTSLVKIFLVPFGTKFDTFIFIFL